jgi:hypothetical protein
MKRLVLALALAASFAFPAVASAAQKTGCPNALELGEIDQIAVDFFPHLFPGQFDTAEGFAAAITELVDANGDGLACSRVFIFDNPSSHLYKLGIELLGEPTHRIQFGDNNANGSGSK